MMRVMDVPRTEGSPLLAGRTESGSSRKNNEDKEKYQTSNAQTDDTSGSDYNIDSDDNTVVVDEENSGDKGRGSGQDAETGV